VRPPPRPIYPPSYSPPPPPLPRPTHRGDLAPAHLRISSCLSIGCTVVELSVLGCPIHPPATASPPPVLSALRRLVQLSRLCSLVSRAPLLDWPLQAPVCVRALLLLGVPSHPLVLLQRVPPHGPHHRGKGRGEVCGVLDSLSEVAARADIGQPDSDPSGFPSPFPCVPPVFPLVGARHVTPRTRRYVRRAPGHHHRHRRLRGRR